MARAELLTFEDFYGRYESTGKTQLVRLLKLSGAIEKWSQGRGANHAEVVNEFSIKDVQALRKLIENEVASISHNAAATDANVMTDQILFLIIGAVKVQLQSSSSTTWPLVNQTIKALVSPRKKQNSLMLALTSVVLIAGFAFTLLSINNKQKPTTDLIPIEAAQDMSINQAGSQTVDNLIAVYQKMQSGECQLPQALVLQPKDREAFIAFVTEGKVNINTADSLKKSLEYVDCKYPQKLMNNPLNRSPENG